MTKICIELLNGKKMNVELYEDIAPISVKNFLKLIDENYFDGLIFHRVIKDFMIQGGGYIMSAGVVKSKGKAKTIKGEFEANGWKKNSIKHVPGVISMARSKDYNSASSQFFICSATYPSLDGKYAAFGKTTDTKSKQVVINISKVETYAYSNSFTDMPVNVIKIKTVRLSNSKF